jgi:ComF family protein
MTVKLPLLQPLLELFLASSCPLCQRSTTGTLCRDCEYRLLQGRFPEPFQAWQAPLPIFAWGVYQGTLKRTIAALKYENHPELARPLGHWMGQAWCQNPRTTRIRPLVVPIPMYADKENKRGFNQAELLAEGFCEITGLPLRPHGLVRIRETQAQFGLSATERERNVAGAIQLGKQLRHRRPPAPILLVDDIFTTGATVRTAIAALNQAQVDVYGVAVLARPPFTTGEQCGGVGAGQSCRTPGWGQGR